MARARILARLAWLFVVLLSRSLRVRFVNRAVPERIVNEGKQVIYAFYHGDMVPLFHAYRDSGILIPASESRDGDIISRVLLNFGFEVARGSSKRKGQKALREMIAGMRRGKHVAITVDGPRGPLHEVKPGAVYLAGVMQAPIVPVAAAARRSWTMENSWDRLMIPAPFTECTVLYGKPISVGGTSENDIRDGQARLAASLQGLKLQAAAEHLRRAAWHSPKPV